MIGLGQVAQGWLIKMPLVIIRNLVKKSIHLPRIGLDIPNDRVIRKFELIGLNCLQLTVIRVDFTVNNRKIIKVTRPSHLLPREHL